MSRSDLTNSITCMARERRPEKTGFRQRSSWSIRVGMTTVELDSLATRFSSCWRC